MASLLFYVLTVNKTEGCEKELLDLKSLVCHAIVLLTSEKPLCITICFCDKWSGNRKRNMFSGSWMQIVVFTVLLWEWSLTTPLKDFFLFNLFVTVFSNVCPPTSPKVTLLHYLMLESGVTSSYVKCSLTSLSCCWAKCLCQLHAHILL